MAGHRGVLAIEKRWRLAELQFDNPPSGAGEAAETLARLASQAAGMPDAPPPPVDRADPAVRPAVAFGANFTPEGYHAAVAQSIFGEDLEGVDTKAQRGIVDQVPVLISEGTFEHAGQPFRYRVVTTVRRDFAYQFLFSGLAFFLLLPLMKRTLTITLDVDWFYRRAGVRMARVAAGVVSRILERLSINFDQRINKFIRLIFRHHGPDGAMARTAMVGSMVQGMVILLAVYLVLFLIGNG